MKYVEEEVKYVEEAALKSLKKSLKKTQRRQDVMQLQAEIDRYIQDSGLEEKTQDMINQFYHSGGDKHRLTLVNISKVENFFDPALKPLPKKDPRRSS